jgi:anti-anti-sigma regulatory factor
MAMPPHASPATIGVALTDSTVTLRIEGKANCVASCDFKTAIERLKTRGFKHFVFDLTACQIMDSTFLGVLATLGLEAAAPTAAPSCRIELINPNQKISDLLDTIGVTNLFTIQNGAAPSPLTSTVLETNAQGPSPTEVCKTSLEAHQTLMRLNQENAARFKDVAKFLAEDLRRLEGQDEPPAA